VEFYGIMRNGGFDVVIGNPPYVEYRKVKDDYSVQAYKTEKCGNIYAFVLERCFHLMRKTARLGMIVQLSAICTDRMERLQNAYREFCDSIWASCYDDRPGKLFSVRPRKVTF
jgi:tRNA1(Val) A37 N6-methylase TrmN6